MTDDKGDLVNLEKKFPVVCRGEIWVVSERPVYPGVLGMDRPALIVANEIGCKSSGGVLAAWMTTGKRTGISVNVPVTVRGRSTTICCNQLATLPREWLREKMGQAPPEVMEQVDRALMDALGLSGPDSRPEEPEKPGKPDNPEKRKLNVNLATPEELLAGGWSDWNVQGILSGRPFSSWSNLCRFLLLTDSTSREMMEKFFVRYSPVCAAAPPVPEEELVPVPAEIPAAEPLNVRTAPLDVLKAFLVEKGLKASHTQGLRSAVIKYRLIYGKPPEHIRDLETNPKLTAKTLMGLLKLEERGEICL